MMRFLIFPLFIHLIYLFFLLICRFSLFYLQSHYYKPDCCCNCECLDSLLNSHVICVFIIPVKPHL